MIENQLYFYLISGSGSAKRIAKQQWQHEPSLTWAHGNIDTIEGILNTSEIVPAFLIKAALSKQTQPRMITYNDHLIMTIRFTSYDKAHQTTQIKSLRMIINKHSIITIQKKGSEAIHQIKTLFHESYGPTSAASFLVMLLSFITDQWSDAIYRLEEKVNHLEEELNASLNTQFDNKLRSARQKIILINRYLKPQRDAILKLTHANLSWLSKHELEQLTEQYEVHNRMVEDLSLLQTRSEVIHEQQISIGQQKANRGLYWLTIVATIFMPLNLLAGLLGMNVPGIPGSQEKHGFLWVCLVMLSISTALIIYFKRKNKI